MQEVNKTPYTFGGMLHWSSVGIDLWFAVNIFAPRPSILKVKVFNFTPIQGMCFNEKQSGFPVQPDEKIRKN